MVHRQHQETAFGKDAELDPLAASLDTAGEAFVADVDLMDAMIKNVLARAGEEESSEVEGFLGQLDGLLDASDRGQEKSRSLA